MLGRKPLQGIGRVNKANGLTTETRFTDALSQCFTNARRDFEKNRRRVHRPYPFDATIRFEITATFRNPVDIDEYRVIIQEIRS